MEIKKNTLLVINNKIFSTKDIRDLLQIIWGEYQTTLQNKKNASVLFKVKWFEQSSFESNDISFFNDNSIIFRKPIKNIEAYFHEEDKKAIRLRINHGYGYDDDKNVISDSDVEVSGDNLEWIPIISDKFRTLLDSVENQKSFVRKNIKYFIGLFLLIGSWCFIALRDKGSKPWSTLYEIWNDDWTLIIGVVFVGGIIAATPIFILVINMNDIWPPIELQVGPEHFHYNKRRRKYYLWIVSTILIPIMLSIYFQWLNNPVQPKTDLTKKASTNKHTEPFVIDTVKGFVITVTKLDTGTNSTDTSLINKSPK